MQLGNYSFAAASHSSIFEIIKDVNKVRLGMEHDYFNTGVLLMDLEKSRKLMKSEDIFNCVREQSEMLLLPDQGIFNFLYGTDILQVNDAVWNYDARYFSAYLVKSEGQCDMDWVMQNTVFLHFCGKQKPWKNKYVSHFSTLYKHYMNLTNR